MGELHGESSKKSGQSDSRKNTGQNGVEQTLLMLLSATYSAARHRRLSPEDSEDAAGQEVLDFLIKWEGTEAECLTERARNRASLLFGEAAAGADAAIRAAACSNTPPLSEGEVGGRANAAAHEAARRCERERKHRVNAYGTDAADAQLYASLADPRASLEEEIQARAFLEAIITSLAALRGKTGAQLWEHHVGRVSLAELAQRHGCSAVAIHQRLQRALPHIREALARLGWDETGSA